MRCGESRKSILLVAGLWLGASGCDRTPQPAPSADPGGPPAAAQPTPDDLAAVRRMVGPGRPAIGEPEGVEQPASPLRWDAPEAWEILLPLPHSPRRAQYRVPRVEGESPDGEVAVVHFPGSGGTVGANIERWIGQFRTAEGRPVDPASVVRETFEAGGLTVHFVEVTGFYSAGAVTGGSDQPGDSEYRLLGGIVETPGGPWFFKGTGPAATMAEAREDFRRMLRSVRQ